MRVTVVRSAGRRHRAVVACDDGSVFGTAVYGDGEGLPHDLVRWVVERELDLADGFWGTVRRGSASRASRDQLQAADEIVLSFAEGDGDGHGEDAARRVRSALDDLRGRWRALPVGARLVLDWPADT